MSIAAMPLPIGGPLSAGSLEPVMLRLGQDGVTGILTVQGEEDIIAISFEAGRIVGADALYEPLESGLGRALVSEGLLAADQLVVVQERAGTDPGRLSEVLIEETSLSRGDYLTGLRSYTIHLVERGCSWTSGEYKFFSGDEVSREEGFEPILAEEVCAPGVQPASDLFLESEVTGADTVSKSRPPVAPPAEEVHEPAEDYLDAPAEVDVELVALTDLQTHETFDEDPSVVPGATPTVVDRICRSLWWSLPTLALVLLVAVTLWNPNLLVFPGFWQEPQRLAFEQQRRISAYQKIDRAAKTFFLIEGRFPEDLDALVARDLLSPEDIVGSGGKVLTYVPQDRGYVILPAVKDGMDPGVNAPQAIAGDFFLDPEYVVRAPEAIDQPLVLLD